MNTATLLLILGGFAVAALGVLYRRVLTRDLPDISDREFLAELARLHPITVPPERALQARRRVARILGIAPEKLAPAQTVDFLSERLAYLGDFSVAWNDLLDEAGEAREAAGLDRRAEPPETIGELITDLLI